MVTFSGFFNPLTLNGIAPITDFTLRVFDDGVNIPDIIIMDYGGGYVGFRGQAEIGSIISFELEYQGQIYTTTETITVGNVMTKIINFGSLSEVDFIYIEKLNSRSTTTRITDYDGNSYETIIIGTQEWMSENLKTTHYNNGDAIPNITNNGGWGSLTTGAYSDYDNNPSNSETYGRLYNWFTVDDDSGVCPIGWRIPSDEEYKTLEMLLGMSESEANSTEWRGTNEGSKLAGNANLWNDGNLENNAEFGTSGFNGVPSGYRGFSNGTYGRVGNTGYFWSSSELDPTVDTNKAWIRKINYNRIDAFRHSTWYDKRYGFSVRCVREIQGPVYGCTNVEACNYDELANTDNGTCEYPAVTCCDNDLVCHYSDCQYVDNDFSLEGDLKTQAECDALGGQWYGPMSEEPPADDESIGRDVEPTAPCGDGVCDNDDDCVGQYDECDVCNGLGAIYECGCEDIANDACDCAGNVEDECGICGGDNSTCSGCNDQYACNYDDTATVDDGSCEYPIDIHGVDYVDCDGNCLNDSDDDGVCDEEEVMGCTDAAACNYNVDATDDGNCYYASICPGTDDVYECTPSDCPDVDVGPITGCTDLEALNYYCIENTCQGDELPDGIIDDGSCVYPLPEITVTDIDDNEYQTVQIGDQLWMAENLKTTHYNNGDVIPNITNNGGWGSLTTGAYSDYDNNPSNSETYGRLYNWFTVDDDSGVCPIGWRIPSDEEYKTLEMLLGMSESEANSTDWRGTNEGSKLAGNANLWNDGDLEDNDEFGTSGFNGVPSGYRGFSNGTYGNIGNTGYFWSSSELDPTVDTNKAWIRKINYNRIDAFRHSTWYDKRYGFSVRCVREIQGPVYGCTNVEACNYDELANTDNGTCEYPLDGYNCAGECVIGEDCNGECGGVAIEDCLGVCGGDAEELACGCNEPIADDACDCDGNGYDCNSVCGGEAIQECGIIYDSYGEFIITGVDVTLNQCCNYQYDVIGFVQCNNDFEDSQVYDNGNLVNLYPDPDCNGVCNGDNRPEFLCPGPYPTPPVCGTDDCADLVDELEHISISDVSVDNQIVTIQLDIIDFDGYPDENQKLKVSWDDDITYYDIDDVIEHTYVTTGQKEITITLYDNFIDMNNLGDEQDSVTLDVYIPEVPEPEIIDSSEYLSINDVEIIPNEANSEHYDVTISGEVIDIDEIDDGDFNVQINWNDETVTDNENENPFEDTHTYTSIGEKTIDVNLLYQSGLVDTASITITIPQPDLVDLTVDACSDPLACNYNSLCDNPNINCTNDVSLCYYETLCPGTTTEYECTPSACPAVVVGTIVGCTDLVATNYNPEAEIDDGSCEYPLPEITVTDIDDNEYQTVQIGYQLWMAENLKTTRYNNGDVIPNITNYEDWVNLTTGAYSDYDNNPSNSDTYGRLYNWYTVDDDGGVCPVDWHVPSDEEYKTLEMYLGMSQTDADASDWRGTNEGSKLAGNANLWNDGNLENNAEFGTSGFNGVPSGYRNGSYGWYHPIGYDGSFWSSTEYGSYGAWPRKLHYDNAGVDRNYGYKRSGFSIRCIKVLYFDCEGTIDGSAVADCAGDCNGTAIEDCAGVCAGEAIIDDCGDCSGGSTELNINHSDLGCGCDEPIPQIHYQDNNFNAYIDNEFNLDGEVNASIFYYFCDSHSGILTNDIIPYPDDILKIPPENNSSFTYPLVPTYQPNNFVPDYSDAPESWYDTIGLDDIGPNQGNILYACNDIDALNYNYDCDDDDIICLDNGNCQYQVGYIEQTKLPIINIVGNNIQIYKSELDEQVSMTGEFEVFNSVIFDIPTNTTEEIIFETGGEVDLSLNIPISDTYVMKKVLDKTFSKTALTNYLFDKMGNKIIDFKFVDFVNNGNYQGVYLIYPETSLSVLGFQHEPPPGPIVINEFMAAGSHVEFPATADGADWVEFYNTSDDVINLSTGNYHFGDSKGTKQIQQPICYKPGCTDLTASNYDETVTHEDLTTCINGGLPNVIFTQVNTKQGCSEDDCGWGGDIDNPTYTEAGREFVELYNPNSDPIDLNEYKFTDAVGGGNMDADTTSYYELCTDGGFKKYDGTDKNDCILNQGEYLIIYQDYKYGLCLYGDGSFGDFCSNDDHCTYFIGGESPCTQCSDDGNTDCHNPQFLVDGEWECDTCSGITISIGIEKTNVVGQYKTVTGLKVHPIENDPDGKKGQLEVKFDRDEPTDGFGNPFSKGTLVYLDVPVATFDGEYGDESTIMTGIYYACDNGEWDTGGGTQGIALCCYDGEFGASPKQYVWDTITYNTQCQSICESSEQQEINGTCQNNNEDGDEIFPTDETAFYLEHYRLADDDILNGGNGMGLGDPESIYILDGLLSPISSVVEFEDGGNNWPNVNGENMLALKHPNCGQDSADSWYDREDGVYSLGQTIDESSSDASCTSFYIGEASFKCSGGPNKGMGCGDEGDDFCDFKVNANDRFITWYVDDDDDYPLCFTTLLNTAQDEEEEIYTCDDPVVDEKLSGGGDKIIIYQEVNGEDVIMDEYEFGNQDDGVSMSRCVVDGAGAFVKTQSHTFNQQNEVNQCIGTLYKAITDNYQLIEQVDNVSAIGIDNTLKSNTYSDFKSFVNINSYLDYVLLQELRMGDGNDGFNYTDVYVLHNENGFNFGPFDSLESTLSFYHGYDVNQCQGEEYKVNATTNESQGWLFDNMVNDTLLSNQLYQFITDAVIIVEDPTGGSVERIDIDEDGDSLDENFLTDLITRWNELRGGVLSDENVLYRIDYYYYYLDGRAIMDYEINNDQESNFDNEINKLKDWLMNRIYWIDHNIRRIKHQVDVVEAAECANNPLTPTNPHALSYCNDADATNPNPDSNFNDGTCKYVLNRELQFQLDTKDIGYPKIEKVRLNILTKNGVDFDESYEMSESIENIWSYDLFDFLPGDIIEYNYTKETPDVYNVRTGALETDKVRVIQIRDEHQIEIKDTFNDFINEFQESNLPIIKVNTNTFNDMGFTSDDNPNLFYCPSYLLESGYFADGPSEEICDMMQEYVEWFEEDGTEENKPGGYYDTYIDCMTKTNCEVDCIDGTNIQDEPKIAGYFELIYNGEGAINNINDKPQLGTKIGIEARGYSSRGFAKKQYAVELQETYAFPQCDDDAANFNLFCDGFTPYERVDYGDECIFNMENDFVFLGPFRDRTYMRNAITYELWDRMDNIGTNSKFFEFIMNDVYMGLYVMFEKPKIDNPHRVPIIEEILDDNSITNDLDGGWMIKVESGAEQDFFIGYDSYTKYEYYDPKLEIGDDVDENEQINAAKQKIQDTVKEFERRVIDNVDQTDVEQVSHIPDFVDYWLIQEFARNNEGFTRSQYWHSFGNASEYGPFNSEQEPIYDNNKIYISYVWDMNHSFGATIVDFDGWAIQNFFAVPNVWGQLFLKDWFQEQVYDRYVELKNNLPVFNVSEINKLIDKFSNEILSYNAVNRDQKRWYDGEIEDFNIYLKNFRKYILQRITWMDSHICLITNPEEVAQEISFTGYCDYGGISQTAFDFYLNNFLNNYNFTCIEDVDCNVMIWSPDNTINSDDYAFYEVDFTDIDEYLQTLGDVIYNQTIEELQIYETLDPDLSAADAYNVNVLNGTFMGLEGSCSIPLDYTPPSIIDGVAKFISSDANNQTINKTIPYQCHSDVKNSNFIAIYNPFDGQVFDINDVGNEFEIEIIISYNLLDIINEINVVILDSFTNSVVHTFENIEVEPDNYVKLIWNTYDRNIRGKLLGDYRIEATIATIPDLEENIKTFSIQNKNVVRGCTDPKSINYDLFAEIDDGSCKYQQDCNLKYNVSEFITDIIYLYPGYNTISYPLDFTGVDVDLFTVLNNSYYDDDGVRDTFEENDYITAFFDDVVYTATYMGGEWIPSINRGFSLNELSKGIGFILYVSNGGRIIWDIPREEIS